MSLAENLLNSLPETTYENSRTAGSGYEEEHIVIYERNITVPNNLKVIAVKGDKDIETVIIDCIRYWDGHDLSTFAIYINYILPNGDEGTYIPENIETLDDVFSFPWVIGKEITYNSGQLVFWIVAKLTDDNGDLIYQWSSFQNFECSIAPGGDKIYVPEKQTDQDVISQAISVSRQSAAQAAEAAERSEAAAERAEAAGGGSSVTVDNTLTISGAAADAKVTGDGLAAVDGKIADAIYSHTTNPEAHQDIRIVLQQLYDQVNHFLDVDDTTRDQLSELLAMIEDNIEDIENLVAGYVKYTDVINNLETNLANKVLSAAQGVVLKGLIDGINTSVTALGTRTTTLEGKVTTLENTKPDMSGYVTTEQFETALGAYITDIDNIVGGGIEGATPALISFTIDGTSYQAEEGMTWEQWVESSYNTDGFVLAGTYVLFRDNSHWWVSTEGTANSMVEYTETITSGFAYVHYDSGSSN